MDNSRFKKASLDEVKEFEALLANWLKPYASEVVLKVMERADEIFESDSTMHLLRELNDREVAEANDFKSQIGLLLHGFERSMDYDIHCNPLTHSIAYRQVLRDLYF